MSLFLLLFTLFSWKILGFPLIYCSFDTPLNFSVLVSSSNMFSKAPKQTLKGLSPKTYCTGWPAGAPVPRHHPPLGFIQLRTLVLFDKKNLQAVFKTPAVGLQCFQMWPGCPNLWSSSSQCENQQWTPSRTHTHTHTHTPTAHHTSVRKVWHFLLMWCDYRIACVLCQWCHWVFGLHARMCGFAVQWMTHYTVSNLSGDAQKQGPRVVCDAMGFYRPLSYVCTQCVVDGRSASCLPGASSKSRKRKLLNIFTAKSFFKCNHRTVTTSNANPSQRVWNFLQETNLQQR